MRVLFCKNHRMNERWCFNEVPAELAETGVAQRKPSEPSKEVSQFLEAHHPDTQVKWWESLVLKSTISDQAKARLLTNIKAEYAAMYAEWSYQLTHAKVKHGEALKSIAEHQQTALEELKKEVNAFQDPEKLIPTLKTIENQSKTTQEFDAYLSALNQQYLNREVQKHGLSEDQQDEYEDWADEWQEVVEARLEEQLVDAYQETDPKLLKTRLVEIQNNLKELYKKNANQDGFIDYADLKALKMQADRFKNKADLLVEWANDPKKWDQIESAAMLDQSVYEEAAQKITDQIIDGTVRNYSQSQFKVALSQITSVKVPDDFKQASDLFREVMDAKSKQGPKVFLEALQAFSNSANAGREHVDNMSAALASIPKGQEALFEKKVEKEVDRLIHGETWSKNLDDEHLVAFMSKGADGKSKMLMEPSEREKLFQSVQNILSRPHDSKNKGYLKEPRFWAMVKLAQEAEWVLGNMGQKEALAKVSAEKKMADINLNYGDITEKHSTRYISRVARGGFNGKDLALNLGRIWAVTTIGLNLMRNKSNGIEGVIGNPYLWAAAGTLYGINKVKELPETANYFSEDAGGKNRIGVKLGLNKLTRTLEDRNPVEKFVQNHDEFTLMQKIMQEKGKESIRNVLKNIKNDKTRSKNPGLTRADIEKAFGIEYAALIQPDRPIDTARTARTRFLFYEKFLTSEQNIAELEQFSHEWMTTITSN
ncbi:hypothetical protein IPJ72_02850 [Candidatus Peregrinibacteria bacterium]|nr:MAG: hypothetical protein IPJ72_02850 [Candidatus Peregrinibacteria bacterium]